MKGILDFKNFAIQYWIEEFPHLATVSALTLCESLVGTSDMDTKKVNKICIELYLRKNASNYGMLGFEFQPNPNLDKLDIQIRYTDGNTEQYQSEINKYDKTIYNGVLEEYVPYIKGRIIDRLQNEFYNGTLEISCATNSEVGSSPKIFCIITDIVIELYKVIQKDRMDQLEEQIEQVLASCGLNTTKK